MSRSIVGRLIAKDLYMQRWLMAAALTAGVISLAIATVSPGDGVTTGLNIGMLLFITTIITFGIVIPMVGILKERQDGSRLFVLSLPLSPAQYSIAKVSASVAAFLVPWLLLTAGVVGATVASGRPAGGLPFFVLMMMFFLATFSVLVAIVAITLSELWTVAGILVTNLSVTIFLTQVGRLIGASERTQDAVATWSPTVLTILAAELAMILLSLALAFYIPSRRKDFV